MAYKLLVLDVDGTLLTSERVISPATRRALRCAQEQGVLITLATGRRLPTAQPYIEELGIEIPVILQNGAQIVDPSTSQVLYSNPLPSPAIAHAVGIAVDEGVQPILYESRALQQRLFSGPAAYDSPSMRPYIAARPDLVQRLSYEDLARIPEALELAVIDELPVAERAASRMAVAGCRSLVSYSPALDTYFLEVFHETCSKGEALRQLCAMLGLSPGETIAAGDNYNDREILGVAGLGVAMANAEPEIRAIAGYVTTSNDDDGIAVLVERVLGITICE